MDLMQLKYFQVLAKTQHMTEAAGLLNVAQSALSRSLRNLETELDVKLFDRVGKYIYLNENGQVLLRHTEVALQELENAQRELGDKAGAEHQMVRLSMYTGSKLLPDLIRGFKEEHPDISLQITQQGSHHDNIVASDITVYSSGEAPTEINTNLLMKEEICLAIPSDHPLSHRASIKLAEVASEPFICLYKGNDLRQTTDKLCRQAGFTPNVILESDSPGTVRDLISLGVGLSFIPKISWRGIDRNASVKLVEIEEPECFRFVIMSWNEERYLSDAAAKLSSYLIRFFGNLVSLK